MLLLYVTVLVMPVGKSLIKDATKTEWWLYSMYYALHAYISTKDVRLAIINDYLPFLINAQGW